MRAKSRRWLLVAAGVLVGMWSTGAAQAALIGHFVHNFGSVIITLDLFDGQPGGRYLWQYTVDNLTFDPNPGTSNGFSGFELFLPTPIPEIADIMPNAGTVPPWDVNCCSGNPVEWDRNNSDGNGVMPGGSQIFSFTTDPRLVAVNDSGWFHTWQNDVQTDISPTLGMHVPFVPGLQPPECGNEILDPGEECDPPNSPTGAFLCPPSSPGGAFVVCNADCTCGTLVPSTTSTSTTSSTTTVTTTSVPATTTTQPEHVQCYEVKPAAFVGPVVQAQDHFGTLSLPLRFPHRLCAPANKNGEGIQDPTEHLAGYVTKAAFTKRRDQTISNQFGTIKLDVVRPDLLMVPTEKDGVPLNPPPGDHFTCYKVKRSRGTPKFVPLTVTVSDQFQTVTETLLKPVRVCAPTNKNGEDPTAPDHPWHLLCYKAKSATAFGTIVKQIHNQFGPDQVTLIHRRELCVPSLMNPAPPTTTTIAPTTSSTSTSTSTSSTTTTAQIPLDIIPDTAEKLPGGTQQFIVATGPGGPYTWSVNGVDGGDSTYGTIDGSGFYTAPAAVPVPATFNVCARVTAMPAIFDCSLMTINPIPTAGEDVVVYNDINMLDDNSLVNPNNVLMLHNLLTYTAVGPRASGTAVVVDGGHAPACGAAFCGASFLTFNSQVATEGFTLTVDNSGNLSSIASNVKVLFLWLPTAFYSTAEINAMKQFAAQGGRIIFIGEHSDFYGAGFPAQNDFLSKMGAVMTNVGNFIDCGYNTLPFASLRSHQITTSMTNVTMACSSEILLGPNDFALYYDSTNTRVLSGVAKIDTVPLPLPSPTPAAASVPAPWSPTRDAVGNVIR